MRLFIHGYGSEKLVNNNPENQISGFEQSVFPATVSVQNKLNKRRHEHKHAGSRHYCCRKTAETLIWVHESLSSWRTSEE